MHPEIMFNYESFPIYKNILYQYIQLSNIKKFESRIIIFSLIKYVGNCFLVLESFFREISRMEYDLESIERIGGILRHLDREFKLEIQIGKKTTILKRFDFAKDEEKIRHVQTQEENIGFIAEQVPDIISSDDHKQVRYMEIISALTKVVKEQGKRIEELERKIY